MRLKKWETNGAERAGKKVDFHVLEEWRWLLKGLTQKKTKVGGTNYEPGRGGEGSKMGGENVLQAKCC